MYYQGFVYLGCPFSLGFPCLRMLANILSRNRSQNQGLKANSLIKDSYSLVTGAKYISGHAKQTSRILSHGHFHISCSVYWADRVKINTIGIAPIGAVNMITFCYPVLIFYFCGDHARNSMAQSISFQIYLFFAS